MLRTTWAKGAAAETSWVITTKQKASYGKSPKLVQKDSFCPVRIAAERPPEKKRYLGSQVAKAKQLAIQDKHSSFRENLELIRRQTPDLYEELMQTPRIQQAIKEQEEAGKKDKAPPVKSTKWFQHLTRLEEKMAKDTTVFNELRLLKPRKVPAAQSADEEDEEEEEEESAGPNDAATTGGKRIPSLLMQHLKGLPEAGKLLPPKAPKGDPSLTSARMLKMGRKVQEALGLELDLKRHLDLVDERTRTVPQIVDVKMSPDLRRATCEWEPHSMLGPLNEYEARAWQRRLERNTSKLKRLIALRIRARFVPELIFKYKPLEEEDADVNLDEEDEEEEDVK